MKKLSILLAGAALALVSCNGDEPAEADESEAVGTVEQAAGAPVTVFHGNWNGANAYFQQWAPYGNLWLDVYENKSAKARSAFIHYNYWSYDPTSMKEVCYEWDYDMNGVIDPWERWCWYTYTRYSYGWGYGPIPESAFKVQGNASQAYLSLTEGPALSGFWGYDCTWDLDDPLFGYCTDGGYPDVDVRFHANGQSWSGSNGTNESGWSDPWSGYSYTHRQTGISRSASADVTGSFGFFDVGEYGYAYIGSAKNAYVDIYRSQ